MTTEWHVPDEHLLAYAEHAGDALVTASTEAHLQRCDRCRRALAAVTDREGSQRRWQRLADAVDRPSRLRRGHLQRTAFGTPALLWAGGVALVVAAALPVLAAVVNQSRAAVILLALAPLVPVGAVSVAYRPATDPVGELALATPSSGLRLVALRAVAVGAAALPAGLLSGWLSGLAPHVAIAWLLPGLALAALVLASGTTRLNPRDVALALGATWAVAVGTPGSVQATTAHRLVELVSSPSTQVAALLVGVAAVLLTVVRRDDIAYRRTA